MRLPGVGHTLPSLANARVATIRDADDAASNVLGAMVSAVDAQTLTDGGGNAPLKQYNLINWKRVRRVGALPGQGWGSQSLAACAQVPLNSATGYHDDVNHVCPWGPPGRPNHEYPREFVFYRSDQTWQLVFAVGASKLNTVCNIEPKIDGLFAATDISANTRLIYDGWRAYADDRSDPREFMTVDDCGQHNGKRLVLKGHTVQSDGSLREQSRTALCKCNREISRADAKHPNLPVIKFNREAFAQSQSQKTADNLATFLNGCATAKQLTSELHQAPFKCARVHTSVGAGDEMLLAYGQSYRVPSCNL